VKKVFLIALAIALAISVSLIGCTAEAPEITEYNLTISNTEGGSVTTPGQGTGSFTYDEGEVVNLVAEPDKGYEFVNWTGDVGTVTNVNAASTTITMNDDYSVTANFEEDKVVTFLDVNLETVIREAIGIPQDLIYTRNMEGLTSLCARESGISDLSGFEYAICLRQLDLGGNQISDISPLSNLTRLTRLNLEWNQISDISPLANLTNLAWLSLWGNQISDISPLVDNEGLSEWDDVYIQENPLSLASINIYIPQLEERGVNVEY